MSDISRTGSRELHPEFPNNPILGAVSGAQPKLLLRRNDDGTYSEPRPSAEEIMHRFEVADDITDQLVVYFRRKKLEHPEWTDDTNLERIRLGLIRKATEGRWPFTEAEQAWIMNRLRERVFA